MKHTWLLLLFLPIFAGAQDYNKYWIAFTDKSNSPYSIYKPSEFLSPRSIERRAKQGIPIEENDLPVSPNYLLKVRDLGAKVDYASRWLNGVVVYADEGTFQRLLNLPFVKSGEGVGKRHEPTKIPDRKFESDPDYPRTTEYYGFGENQIKMLEGEMLHKMGFDGEGMLVAVLDGGFSNVDVMPFFDSLRADGRLLDGWDFVENDPYVFESSSHGSQVLSTMAANLPGLFVGTAPGATYVCIKTENTRSELRLEEYNWVAGAEFADSLGVDVLNSSLGYTRFDDKSMNYTYKDMDGNTAAITRGADIAASKGMLIVNSAGNAGNGDWKYIGAPADGDSVMAIGAVNSIKRKVFFSSFGPTADGRVKPNISARGDRTTVGSLFGYSVEGASGTSFASPVMAGMAASLWQAFPNKSNMDIMDALEESGNQIGQPDDELGYGVPNFYKAYLLLSEDNFSGESGMSNGKRFSDKLQLSIFSKNGGLVNLKVKNLLGETIVAETILTAPNSFMKMDALNIKDWSAGVYFVEYTDGEEYYYSKFIKE